MTSPDTTFPTPDPAALRALVGWFAANGRDLPWRAEGTSAWGVLLSEVMSQQTPVARVAPVWREWMERWPTPADFAAAGRAEVLRAWGRLGYPRRALRLHECAAAIVERHGGEVPAGVAELEDLPGIGTYTARAVACFHFGANVPVVDTNVRRVHRRLIEGTFLPGPARAADLRKVAALLPAPLADAALPGRARTRGAAAPTADGDGSAAPAAAPREDALRAERKEAELPAGPEISVALMELGALVCTASSPDCDVCPVRPWCAWVAAGSPEPSAEELAGAKKRVQKFAGTDRQVRGKIMAVLRAAEHPVDKAEIDAVWPDAAQRSRCLFSLIEDGLAEQDADGRFRLPA